MKKIPTDAELISIARGCCGHSVQSPCLECPFDLKKRDCVGRLIDYLAHRLEIQSERSARYAEEIAVLQERLREAARDE